MPSERKAIIFPFCWFETLAELDDGELRAMLTAIGRYAANGEAPAFKGAMKALWNEIRQRLDADAERYDSICNRNRENIRKRWNKSRSNGIPNDTTVYDRIPSDSKNTQFKAKAKSKSKEGDNIPLTVVTNAESAATASGGHAPRFPQSVDDVVALADRAGAICSPEQAELYLAKRQSAGWLDRNACPIRHVGADLKAWLLTFDQIRKDEEKRHRGAASDDWKKKTGTLGAPPKFAKNERGL